MTHKELVAAIRHCADSNMTCRGCPLDECVDEGLDSWELAISVLAQQAADAIEELTRAVALLESDRDAERKLREDAEEYIEEYIHDLETIHGLCANYAGCHTGAVEGAFRELEEMLDDLIFDIKKHPCETV